MFAQRWPPRGVGPGLLLLVVLVASIAILSGCGPRLGVPFTGASPLPPAPSVKSLAVVAPTLSVGGSSPAAISLGWTATNDLTFSEYEVQNSTSSSSGPWTTAGTLSSQSDTSYFASGLAPGTTYWWQVVEVDTLGVQLASNTVQNAQPAVALLTATTLTSSSVKLSWVNHASYGGHVQFESYSVWQAVTGGTASSVGTITSASTTSTEVAGLTTGTSYTFQVETSDRCSGASNCGSSTPASSTYSNSASATPKVTAQTNYTVTFSESGLSTGSVWSVTLNGSAENSTGTSIHFAVANGTYAYTVGAVVGYSSTPSSGSVTVAGAATSQAVVFSSAPKGTYSVTFSESGLATGTSWSVQLAASTQRSTGSTDVFSESNGTYAFSVGAPSGYSASPSTGTVTVAGAATTTAVAFTYSSGPLDSSITHVVLIPLENEEVTNVWAAGPYERYLASTFGNVTQFYATCHDSSADYFAVTSGRTFGCGIAYPNPGFSVTQLGDLLERHNLTWTAYEESMPSACDLSSSGYYINYHDPFVYYHDVNSNLTRCDTHVVSASSFNQSVENGNLPAFSFYTPNWEHDGHGPTNSPWTPSTGLSHIETWLRGFLPPILNHTGSFDTTAERTLVNQTAFILLYDEGTTNLGYTTGKIYTSGCYNQTGRDVTACGGHVQVTFISPYSLHRQYVQNATTYNVQSTIEWLFGLPSDGGEDGTSDFPAMMSLFSFSSNGYHLAPPRMAAPRTVAPGATPGTPSGLASAPASAFPPWLLTAAAAGGSIGTLGGLGFFVRRGQVKRRGNGLPPARYRPPPK